MKTLRYILLGVTLFTIMPFCNSQIPVKNKQVITLQSVPDNASAKQLSKSKEILLRRLASMSLRDFQVMQNNLKSELVVTVGDSLARETLSELLLIRGHVSFKTDSLLAFHEEDILEAHADFEHPEYPALCITFKEKAWKEWDKMTIRNMNKPLAFLIDDNVYASPRILSEITHGKISLTGGGFSKTKVKTLVAIISCGPVPLKFIIVSKN